MTLTLAGRSAALFPVVGALIGGFLGGIGLVLDRILPAGVVAALVIAAGALVTGGLHLDGVMDTADGVFGGKSPERRLAIMHDSRVGAFGVVAGVVILLGQFACLSELTGQARLLALIAAGTIGRWTMLIALALFPVARPTGAGATFHAGVTRGMALLGTLLAGTLALLAGPLGVLAMAAGLAIAVGVGRALTLRLGGLTGDTYGAIAIVIETAVLFIAVALDVR
jgi:adenosylcobinamide-GDP ribazoletransferase